MSERIIDQCIFCNKNLVEKETVFSVNITKERINNGEYDVDDSEGLFLSCESCGEKHDFTTLIQSELSKISQSVETPSPDSSYSDYDCCICYQSIPNGSPILSITSGTEVHEGSAIRPCNEFMIAVTCINCADKYQVSSHVKQLIKDLVNESNNGK